MPAAAAGAVALWALLHAGLSPWWAMPCALGAAAIAAWRWPSQPQSLSWDGQVWSVEGQRGRMAVMIDLGPWLLLRLEPESTGRAVWVAVAVAGVWPAAALHGLRAALYCSATRAVAQGAASGPSPVTNPKAE